MRKVDYTIAGIREFPTLRVTAVCVVRRLSVCTRLTSEVGVETVQKVERTHE